VDDRQVLFAECFLFFSVEDGGPEQLLGDQARVILGGVARNQAVIAFPRYIRWAWLAASLFPAFSIGRLPPGYASCGGTGQSPAEHDRSRLSGAGSSVVMSQKQAARVRKFPASVARQRQLRQR
jgi:hypothetical protein